MLKLLKNAYKAFKYRSITWGGHAEFIPPNIVLIRKPDGYILFNWIDNMGEVHFTLLSTEEECRLYHICINLIGDVVFDHVFTTWRDGIVTVHLLRDEIMNDDLISKIQDELYSKNCDVKIVYNWKTD